MKRPTIVIIALIISAAIIGFERIRERMHFLISDDRISRARPADDSAYPKRADLTAAAREDPRHSLISDPPKVQGQARRTNTDPESGRIASDTGKVSITGAISPMHFIRASAITGSTEPTNEEITRLRLSVDKVAEALRPSAVVFDEDGFSTSEVPVLLFARDEFNLTDQVKAVYDSLEGSQPPLADQITNKVNKAEKATTRKPSD